MWQTLASSREQWRRLSDQRSAEAGSVAPALLRAEPEKLIVSPTAHVVAADGAAIVTVGGAPTVIVVDVVPCRPPGSLTRSRTVTTPARRVGERGRGGGRVVVGAVAVEVPGVGQRLALGVARARAV